MIGKKDIDLYMEYDAHGMWGRCVPKHLAQFSNSPAFSILYDLVGRLALERNTQVSKTFADETAAALKRHFDSQETIDALRQFVLQHQGDFQ